MQKIEKLKRLLFAIDVMYFTKRNMIRQFGVIGRRLSTFTKSQSIMNIGKKISIDYFSDVHLDMSSKGIPKINQKSDILAFLGDAGKPTHPKFDEFVKMLSTMYQTVLFVPGNSDYGSTTIYDQHNYDRFSPLLQKVLSKYNNVILMDNQSYMLSNGVGIIGSTMWTMPFFTDLTSNVMTQTTKHIEKHYTDTTWLMTQLKQNKQQNIRTIVLSHTGPSFEVVGDEIKRHGCNYHSKFYNRYDFLLTPPVVAWLYGHTHAQNDKFINGVFCSISEHGNMWKNGERIEIIPKILTV